MMVVSIVLEDVEPILEDVVCIPLTTEFGCGVQSLPEQHEQQQQSIAGEPWSLRISGKKKNGSQRVNNKDDWLQ